MVRALWAPGVPDASTGVTPLDIVIVNALVSAKLPASALPTFMRDGLIAMQAPEIDRDQSLTEPPVCLSGIVFQQTFTAYRLQTHLEAGMLVHLP
jgi:hypothetical protein